MSYSDVKVQIVNKIQQKFSKKMTNEYHQLRDMILAETSQILSQAITQNQIKTYEKVKVYIKDGIVNITGTVWLNKTTSTVNLSLKVPITI